MSAWKRKININLIVKKEAEQSFSDQLLSWALTYGRYIIIITQIVVLTVFFARFKLDRDNTDLKEAISQKQALVESVADLEQEIKRLQNKLSNIANATESQDLFLRILSFLSANSPSDTIFTTLLLSKETITFNATATNLRNFNYTLQKLQQDNNFNEIILEDITRKANGRIEFKIKAKINPKGFT